jgi:hypothetical protein
MKIGAIQLCVQTSVWVLASAFCVTSLAGCGANGNFTSSLGSDTSTDTALAGLSGAVHGGPNPVVGATVTLYATQTVAPTAANNYGYGVAGEVLGTATTGSNGAFSFSGTETACPAGQQAYIVSAGGKTGSNSTNSAAVLMAAIGPCSSLVEGPSGTTVTINELTTIAAAYALSGFMTVSGTTVNISAPAKNNAATGSCTTSGTSPAIVTTGCVAAGLAHAFLNAANLVNASTGIANAAVPGNSGAIVPNYLINTLGNSVEACINSNGDIVDSGTPCYTLMTNTGTNAMALNPNLSAPANTLSALLDLAQYPSMATNGSATLPDAPLSSGDDVPAAATTALFNIANSNAYYSPALTSAPLDFTIAINYPAPAGPWGIATDFDDNVYVVEATTPSTVVSLTSDWTPIWSTQLAGTASGSCGTTTSRCQPALDTLGNVWVADGNGLHQLAQSGGTLGATYTTTDSLNSLSVDMGNNVWTAAWSVGAATTGQPNPSSLEEFVQGQSSSNPPTDIDPGGTALAYTPLRDPTFDSWGNMWLATDNETKGVLGVLLVVSNNNSLTSPDLVHWNSTANPAPYPGGFGSHSNAPMMDSLGNMWVGSEDELNEVVCTGACTENGGATNYETDTTLVYGNASAGAWEGGDERFSTIDGDNKIVIDAAFGGFGFVSVYYPNATYDGNGNNTSDTGANVYLNPCYVASGNTTCALNGDSGSLIVNATRMSTVDATGSIWVTASSGVNFLQVIGPGAPSWPQKSYRPLALQTNTSLRPY